MRRQINTSESSQKAESRYHEEHSDFIGNFKTKSLSKNIPSEEQTLNQGYDKLNKIMLVSEDLVSEGLETLRYIRDTSDTLMEQYKKLGGIKQKSPEDKLEEALKLEVKGRRYDKQNRISPQQTFEFLEIEKALNNTYINEAMPHWAIQFQLGMLHRSRNFIDKRVFELLVLIRRSRAPDRYHYVEINDRLYRSAIYDFCEKADRDMSKNSEYESSLEKFDKRLKGIRAEMIEEQLIAQQESDNPIFNEPKESNNSLSNEMLKTSEAEIDKYIEDLPTVPINPPLQEPKKARTIGSIKERQTFCINEDLVRFIEDFLPEEKKYLIQCNRREIQVKGGTDYGIKGTVTDVLTTDFREIMRASLVNKEKSRIEQKKREFDQYYVIQTSEVSQKAINSLKSDMGDKYSS